MQMLVLLQLLVAGAATATAAAFRILQQHDIQHTDIDTDIRSGTRNRVFSLSWCIYRWHYKSQPVKLCDIMNVDYGCERVQVYLCVCVCAANELKTQPKYPQNNDKYSLVNDINNTPNIECGI